MVADKCAMTLRKRHARRQIRPRKAAVFVTGYQALVRLCLMQKERDRRAGLNTAGLHHRLSRLAARRPRPTSSARQSVLNPDDIVFQAGLNEDLAATALWGSQQARTARRGQVRRRVRHVVRQGAGRRPHRRRASATPISPAVSQHGGVLALMGDDHTAESSTTAHQSEFHFLDVMIPILNPAGVQEIIDYGLYGWAMSRFTGAWVGAQVHARDGEIDRASSTAASSASRSSSAPRTSRMPEGGLNIRLRRHHPRHGSAAARLQARRHARASCAPTSSTSRSPRAGASRSIGVITAGKSLSRRAPGARRARHRRGEARTTSACALHKIACPWPISRQELQEFAAGLELIIVVEEKRSLIEVQVREELYGTANQPVCIGKKDEHGNWLFPVKGALDPNEVAICIGERLLRACRRREARRARRARSRRRSSAGCETHGCRGAHAVFLLRLPAQFRRPWCRKGMRAYAGIGCHFMVQWMDRSTLGFTQMGGEGANWIGEAPFSKRGHVFQNLGDGTYNHSGYHGDPRRDRVRT